MPLYFFDTRDDGQIIEDEDGIDYPDFEAVKLEAVRSLAELARDVAPGCPKRVVVVEVRDAQGPILKASMSFEAVILRPDADLTE